MGEVEDHAVAGRGAAFVADFERDDAVAVFLVHAAVARAERAERKLVAQLMDHRIDPLDIGVAGAEFADL